MDTTTTHHPITFPRLREDALALMRTGGGSALAAATIPGAISDLKSALAWQLDLHLGLQSEREARYLLDPPAEAAQMPYDIGAFLSGTAEAAGARARGAGMRRPGNASGRVERLLQALGRASRSSEISLPTGELPRAWQQLVECALAEDERRRGSAASPKWRSVATAIRHLARTATAQGIIDPRSLPEDHRALVATLRAWGRTRVAHDVWALRSASAAHRASFLGPEALPEWSARASLDAERRALATAMPEFMADLDDWSAIAVQKVGERSPTSRHESAHEALRRATRERYVSQARQWATGFLALHARRALPVSIDPTVLRTAAAWMTMVRVTERSNANPEADARIRARRARLGSQSNSSMARTRDRPLAVVVAEMAVDAGDIWPRAKRIGRDLPPSVSQMCFALFSIAERLAIETSGDGSSEVMALRAAWAPELTLLKAQLARGTGHRKKPEDLLRALTLPQLVCAVLPWRTLVDLPRRQRAAKAARRAAAAADASTTVHRDAERLSSAYHDALVRWAVQATFAAEPMRKGNVGHARVGSEILIDANWSSDGALVKVSKISSRFPEREAESALEVLGTKTGEVRELWCWSPTIVAHDWAAEYLRSVWWPAVLVHRPELSECSLRELVQRGEFAWLINPDPRAKEPGEVAGAHRAEGVADRWGEALLEGLRILGRDGFPPSLAEARRAHPSLFGPHIVRTMWASYWWGVRGDNGPTRRRRDGEIERESGKTIARRATCDSDRTLETDYVKLRSAMLELSRSDPMSFEHPRALDAEMDATWWHDSVIDWRARWRDPRFPLPDALRRQFLDECRGLPGSAHRRTRRRRSAGALPSR